MSIYDCICEECLNDKLEMEKCESAPIKLFDNILPGSVTYHVVMDLDSVIGTIERLAK